MNYTSTNVKYIILISICFCSLNVFSQHAVVVRQINDFNYERHVGYIELNNGQIIDGVFLYDFWEFPTYNLKNLNKNGKTIKSYRFSNIKKVVLLGSDTLLTNKDSTYFLKPVDEDEFYRQLTFGRIKIFDSKFIVDEKMGEISDDHIIYADSIVYKTRSERELVALIKKLNPDRQFAKIESAQELIKLLNQIQN